MHLLFRHFAGVWRRNPGSGAEGVVPIDGPGEMPGPSVTGWPEIQFSSEDDETMLNDLWQGYLEATSLENSQQAFEAFLMSFIRVFENWVPSEISTPSSQSHQSDAPLRSVYGEGFFGSGLLQPSQSDVIFGCVSGHPTRVILGLVQELKMVTKMIAQASVSPDDVELKLRDAEENAAGLSLLHALNIATRSAHNRRIFVVSEGFGFLMRLMKAAVIQVKAVATAMMSERNPSPLISTQLSFLQFLLAHVISIVSNFVEAELNHQCRLSERRSSSPRSRPGSGSWGLGIGAADMLSYPGSACSSRPSSRPASPRHRHYGGGSGNASPVSSHFTSMESVPLLETNGLNWCVELLRILRRLRVEGLMADSSLERLTLRTLRSAIACSFRVQNHFRSIGGLEVLLDGLGWPSCRGLLRDRLSSGHLPSEDDRISGQLEAEFQMQLLSLRVIREAVYRNTSSLQRICDHSGFTKLVKLFRWTVCTFLETPADAGAVVKPGFLDAFFASNRLVLPLPHSSLDSPHDDIVGLNSHLAELSTVLWSFVCLPEHDLQAPAWTSEGVPGSGPISSYWELANRVLIGMLLDVFREKRGDTREDQDALALMRSRTATPQMYVLNIFKQVLRLSPNSIMFFRDYNAWDVMCSEYFFYFGCTFVGRCSVRDYSCSEDLRMRDDDLRARSCSGELKSMDYRSGELRSGELRSGELRMGGDFRSGELRSGELRSGELRGRGDSGFPGSWTEVGMFGQPDVDWERDSGEIRELPDSLEAESLRVEVISLLEAAATLEGISFNQRECLALMSTLFKCALVPSVAAVLARCLHRVLQLAVDATVDAMLQYDMTTILCRIMMKQHETHALVRSLAAEEADVEPQMVDTKRTYRSNSLIADQWWQARTTVFALFKDYIALSDDARVRAGQNETAVNVLFELLWEPNARKFALRHILIFMKRQPQLGEDRSVKLSLFGKYLEALPRAQVECRGSGTIDILNDLLEGIQDVLQVDLKYYQELFAEGECFVQIVSVLNSEHSFEAGSKLSLNVIKTLTNLLSANDSTKAVFRNLVGAGYHTLSKVIIERHHGRPSQDLLEALLNMLVDGGFDMRSNMVIQNEDVVPLFFGVLRKCDSDLQLEGLDTFQALLDECTSNRACCVRAGLVGILLEWFPSIDDDILLEKVAILVRMSGGHSVSGKDMRVVFGLLRSTREGCRPRHATMLLRTLQSMVAGEGPAVFYEFSGRESGISLSSPLRWPISKGYTFCCWLRVENFLRKDYVGSTYSGAMGLFSFTIERGRGSDHMKGCTALIFESGLSVQTHGSKAQTVKMDFQFRPKRWYFVVVAHSVNRLVGGSNIKFYVDGNLVTTEKLRYPKINDPVTRCTIAAKAPLPVSEDCENNDDMPYALSSAFRGQLGPIYLFDEALSANQVAGIARLGPGYMYSFLPNESGCVPENVSVHGIMDGKDGLAPRMVFGFNAQASSGRTCFNISAVLDQGSDQLPCDATIMEGTQVCCTRRVQDIIHCVGGITVLFPLFTQLDQPALGATEVSMRSKALTKDGSEKQDDVHRAKKSFLHEALSGVTSDPDTQKLSTRSPDMEYVVDPFLAVEVIGLLAAVLAGNLANQQYMLNMAGFAVVGFLLQRVSPQHLTVNVVHALERLIGSVANSPAPSVADALVKEALSKLYLDPRIWVYTPFDVQKELYQSLLRQVDHDPGRLRSTCGLQRVLDIVRQFYWDKPCSSQAYATRPLLHPVTHLRIGERPSSQEVSKLRTMVLGLADRMFRENVSLVEVKALVAFIEKGNDNALIEDVLRCVLSVLNHKGPALTAMVEHVYTLGGCQIFLNILKRDQESIRLLGLRLIGTILTATPVEKRVGRVMTGSSGALAALERIRGTEKANLSTLFAALGENISFFPFTEALRTTLFELMLGGASQKQALDASHVQGQGSRQASSQTVDTSPVLCRSNRIFAGTQTSPSFNATPPDMELPAVMGIICKFLRGCEDYQLRNDILKDIAQLVVGNTHNRELLIQEPVWQEWLFSLLGDAHSKHDKAALLSSSRKDIPADVATAAMEEENLIRRVFTSVLTYCVCQKKGGWKDVERTISFVHMISEREILQGFFVMHDILADLLESVLQECPNQLSLMMQPCRDNTLYILALVDELVMKDTVRYLPAVGDARPEDRDSISLSGGGYGLASLLKPGSRRFSLGDPITSTPQELPPPIFSRRMSGIREGARAWHKETAGASAQSINRDKCWRLYNQVWVLLEMINGRARGASYAASDSLMLIGGLSSMGTGSGLAGLVPPPTIGQRARCLVESINAPAAEVAAAVSGGFGAVVGGGISGITSKGSDKAMKMRGEKCPRVVFRLVLLYLHEADLESATKCKNQFLSLLPDLLSVENEANRNRLQLFLRALDHAKSFVGSMDDGARANLILHLIQRTSEHFKSILATTVDKEKRGKEEQEEQEDPLQSLQQDKVAAALKDEMRYIAQAQKQRANEVEALRAELDEASLAESQQLRVMEEQQQTVLATIVNAETARRSALQLAIDEEQQAIARHWCHMFRGLTDERGPWAPGPSPGDPPLRWKLDKTEDPWRRRMRLKRNYHFDENLVAPLNPLPPSKKALSEGEQDDGAGAKDSSEPAGGGIRRVLLTGLRGVKQKGVVEVPEEGSGKGDFGEVEVDNAALVAGAGAAVMAAANDDLEKRQQSGSGAETSGSSLEDDKVFVSLLSVLVTPKRKVAGRMELMRKHLIFHGEMTVEGSAGSSVFDIMTSGEGGYEGAAGLGQKKSDRKVRDSYEGGNDKPKSPERRWEGFLKGGTPRGVSPPASSMSMALNMMDAPKDVVKRHRRWALSQVKEVHLTRYLLRYTAVEVFFHQATPPVFFNFQSVKHAKEAAHKIAQLANSVRGSSGDRDGMGSSVTVIDKRKAIDLAEKAKERWRKREMTNFDYLMTLNTLAGRSYNDLTQYPVFPWILADYSSPTLDLTKASTFRDLSKPVGALNEKRLQTFEERYNTFTDPNIPSFFYGSHYSSAGIVLFYLIRLEPFTTLHRHLQGGKFDHADRLFHSVESAYSNCLTNTSDVKELIPEFFYLPEFLSNSNTYFLGVKQDGEVLGNVMLPPWAEGSPETFVRKNREALESDVVSEHLHEWVDLIFGYKQRGAAAVDAANVFYYLTYEGAVDLDQVEVKTERASIEDQIANFGQTPIQLFKRKHPKRLSVLPISRPLHYSPESITMTGRASPTTNSSFSGPLPAGLIFVGLIDGKVVTVNNRQMMSSRQWITPNTVPGGGSFTFSSQDIFFSVGQELFPPRKIGTPFAGEVAVSSSYFDTLRVGSSALLLTCGHWDNSFKCISIEDGRMVQSVCQHKDVVTCISVSSDGSIVVTGSRDTTVMVWETEQTNEKGSGRVGIRESLGYGGGSHHGRGEKELVVISDKPRRVLCGHDDAVNTVAVMTEFDMVVSGSEDGTCIFHTLKHGRYLRSVKHPNGGSIDQVVVSKQGPVVMYSRYDLTLDSFSLNGKHLASAEANGRVSCMDLSACGEFVVTCGDKGVVIVRWVHSLEVVKRYEGTGVPMTSLAVTMEDCFLVGLQDGAILLYSIEHPQMRRGTNLFALPGRFPAGVIREMRRQKGRHKKEGTVPLPARTPPPVASGPLSSSWPSSAALTALLPSQPSA